MITAGNTVSTPPPGLDVSFNLTVSGDGPGSWERNLAAYVEANYTVDTGYTVDGNYLSSYWMRLTPNGPVSDGGLPFPLYNDGTSRIRFTKTVAPWPPGAIVKWVIDSRSGRDEGEQDMLTGNFVSGNSSDFNGFRYSNAHFDPGVTPPTFLLRAQVSSIRDGLYVQQIKSPVYTDIVLPQNTVTPWWRWYQVYARGLLAGPGIDSLPSAPLSAIGRVPLGEGRTMWLDSHPERGVTVCELSPDAKEAEVDVTVYYKNGISSPSNLTAWAIDLETNETASVRVSTIGNRLHYEQRFSGDGLSQLSRPAIVLGPNQTQREPTYTLPDVTDDKLYKLDGFFTQTTQRGVIPTGSRRVFFAKRAQPVQVHVSAGGPYFSW